MELGLSGLFATATREGQGKTQKDGKREWNEYFTCKIQRGYDYRKDRPPQHCIERLLRPVPVSVLCG